MRDTASEPRLHARRVTFDWSATPLYWVPGHPFAAHLWNYFHVVIPPAERRFIRFGKDAMRYVKDERLREALKGFMAQEASHAAAHAGALQWLARQGFETDGAIALVERVFDLLCGEPPLLPLPEDAWTRWQVALGAAGEQLTCVLGNWVLSADVLDRAGIDATMLDLLRWHGAEEVEHRSVLFDLHREVNGELEYPLRVAAILVIFPVLVGLWIHGTSDLMAQDPAFRGRVINFWAEYVKIRDAGFAPGGDLIEALLRYFEPGFHPSSEGKDAEAAAYLARSPAVRPATA